MAAMAEPPVFQLHRGEAPLLLSLPHDGTAIPAGLAQRMTPAALRVPDTDWHVARLYAFAQELGVSVIVPHWSRYVVDLNRAADGAALYPGRRETGLVPLQSFADEPLYQRGQGARRGGNGGSGSALLASLPRRARGRTRAPARGAWPRGVVGRALDPFARADVLRRPPARSQPGHRRRPQLRAGTAGAPRGGPRGAGPLHAMCVNGRFQGGYITRHYADPARGIDAVQLEIAQCAYMDEDTFAWDEALARSTAALAATNYWPPASSPLLGAA